MDLRVSNAYGAFSVYNVSSTAGASKTERTGRTEKTKDIFSLSTQAEDYQVARKALANVPDVRTDRINQIKSRIDSGEYQVTAFDIASKILQGLDD